MRLAATKKPEAWHAARLLGIGASEAAASIGLDPHKDRITWWAQKRGLEPPDDESLPMRLGTLLEPIIGGLYEERTGLKLRRPPRDPATGDGRVYVHPEHRFVRAHVDFRIVGANGLVEAKHPDRGEHEWGEPDPDGKGEGIPIPYRLQGYHEMLATGADWVDFAVLFGGRRFEVYPLLRDQALLNDLVVDLEEAWGYVVRGEQPPPDAHSAGALRKRWPKATGEVRLASAEQEASIREMLAAAALTKKAEEREELAKNVVMAMIGPALAIEGAGVRVTWGERKGSIAWKAVAETYRRTIESFRGAADYRNGDVESRKLWNALLRALPLIDLGEIEEAARGESSRTLTHAKLR